MTIVDPTITLIRGGVRVEWALDNGDVGSPVDVSGWRERACQGNFNTANVTFKGRIAPGADATNLGVGRIDTPWIEVWAESIANGGVAVLILGA